MQNPLFSIIIPTFNSSKTLKECLDSLFEQSFNSYEVLIIDSVSTDATLSVLKEYTSKYPNIKVYSEKDNGIYDAMNKGMSLAKGDWLYFLGSDDTFYNSRVLSHVSNAIGNTTKKVVYGNVEIVGTTAWALPTSPTGRARLGLQTRVRRTMGRLGGCLRGTRSLSQSPTPTTSVATPTSNWATPSTSATA